MIYVNLKAKQIKICRTFFSHDAIDFIIDLQFIYDGSHGCETLKPQTWNMMKWFFELSERSRTWKSRSFQKSRNAD